MDQIPDLELEKLSPEHLIKVGITHGDINGINYEIMIKAFGDQRLAESLTPVIYGHSKVASYYRKTLNYNELTFNLIKRADLALAKRINIINCNEQEVKIEMGRPTETGGELAVIALKLATDDLMKNLIDVLVTTPVNKKNVQSKDFPFPGHTEYLASRFKTDHYLMMMVSDNMKLGIITGHVPLKEVPGLLTKELILQKIRIMNDSLVRDFGIRKPRIALLGLNPHASDEGLIGQEENTVVMPAIREAQEQNILIFGPFPADGFFGSFHHTRYDGVMALYHDQGMIPFKTLSMETGVNYTAGLPYVRTSPAHGTAYDIAGKNEASPDSFRQALYLAVDIFNKRKEFEEITANPLQKATFIDDGLDGAADEDAPL
jgi:4-hydroxythreonine-4-phosphate dehydrogenase